MQFALRLIPAAAAACLLVSCGGGGGSAPDGTAPSSATPSGGVAVDGYLVGATVLCDSNGNGSADAGELSVGTDAAGAFRFAGGCSSGIVVSGGRNIDTNLPFTGVLKAPAGATVASPLTTLIVAGMTQAELLVALGLPAGTPSLLTTDPVAVPELLKKTLVVQQLVQKTAELFAGLGGIGGPGGDAALQALYSQVAATFAGALKTGAALAGDTTLNSATVTRLVAAAATQAATASGGNAAVKAALAALNADALAQVASGALVLQAESLLNAAPAALAAATAAAQGSTQITSFVISNAAQLTGPPSTATAALAQTLATQVNPPPTDYIALASDAIALVNGSSTTSYTMTQFQSAAGISIAWPLPAPMVLKVSGIEVGSYTLPAGAKLSAAVAISETTATGQAKVLGYIENVNVRKTAAGLEIAVPALGAGASALVYGISSDGAKQAVIDFASSVAGVQNTLNTAAGSSNSILLGSVVNYAINKVSNDFTGIYSLRGKYQVSVVVDGIPLRKADGSALPTVTIEVPTTLNASGGVATRKMVTGAGLVGHITLTD